MAKDERKRFSMQLDADLVAWTDYAAGVAGTNATAYINRTIRRDMESAHGAMLEGYRAFVAARAEAVTDEAQPQAVAQL